MPARNNPVSDSERHDISDDAIIGFDADGRVLSASTTAAKALGYNRPADLTGYRLGDLVGEDTALDLLERAVASEALGLDDETTRLFLRDNARKVLKLD